MKMTRCSYKITTSGGRTSRCPHEANHDCGKCESHCQCPTCRESKCTAPRSCRTCYRCSLHRSCGSSLAEQLGQDWYSRFATSFVISVEDMAQCDKGASCSGGDTETSAPAESDREGFSTCSTNSRPGEIDYDLPEYGGPKTDVIYSPGPWVQWAEAIQPLSTVESCHPRPLPRIISDLCFCIPVIGKPVDDPDNEFLTISSGVLWLNIRKARLPVLGTSDLLVNPWPATLKQGAPTRIHHAQITIDKFMCMVESGQVWLYHRGDRQPMDGAVAVEFNSPLPCLGRERLGRWTATSLNIDPLWQSASRAFAMNNCPTWLVSSIFSPICLDHTYVPDDLLRVPTYKDGTSKTSPVLEHNNRDTVTFLKTLSCGVRVHVFLTDLLDDETMGVWIDEEAVSSYCHSLGVIHYVVGSDGRSGLYGRRCASYAKEHRGDAPLQFDTQLTGRYPRLAAGIMACKAMARSRRWSWPQLGEICGVNAGDALVALALSPWNVPVFHEAGVVLGAFRSVGYDGATLPPITKGLLLQSGLISPGMYELHSALDMTPLQYVDGWLSANTKRQFIYTRECLPDRLSPLEGPASRGHDSGAPAWEGLPESTDAGVRFQRTWFMRCYSDRNSIKTPRQFGHNSALKSPF